jgi:peptide/nickel transport system permease protein
MNSLLRLREHPVTLAALIGIGAILLVAIFAPFFAPYDPNEMDTAQRFAPPGSPGHLLGTDEFGRDVLSRLIYGSRVSILVSALAVAIALLIGGVLGMLAGFTGGWFDLAFMRMMDVLFAIPALMVALGVVGLLGPSATSVIVALGVAYLPLFARISRSTVVGVRGQGFVEASRALGAGPTLILGKDILPNTLPILMVQITASLAWGILDEASLGFLGLGVQPPTASWGAMLTTGRQYMYQSPTIPIFAGLAVLIVVFAFNLFGDGLRDLLDPRSWH